MSQERPGVGPRRREESGAPRAVKSACGPREAPEGSAARPRRRVRASGGGAPRAVKNDFRIVPAGDSVLIVEFDERIDPAVNARAVALADSIQAAVIAGVRDVVPTYRSVAVYFDPLSTNYDALVASLERGAAQAAPESSRGRPPIRVPVCYGDELGPDLARVADFGRMSEADVVAIHSGAKYRVFMLGFVPGFAYLGIVDARIAAPRHSTPRARVPRGSVGIAGAQTGIYPAPTPGGWQLIGRTPVKPFDPSRAEPFLLTPGDTVQFYPIDRGEFDRLSSNTKDTRDSKDAMNTIERK